VRFVVSYFFRYRCGEIQDGVGHDAAGPYLSCVQKIHVQENVHIQKEKDVFYHWFLPWNSSVAGRVNRVNLGAGDGVKRVMLGAPGGARANRVNLGAGDGVKRVMLGAPGGGRANRVMLGAPGGGRANRVMLGAPGGGRANRVNLGAGNGVKRVNLGAGDGVKRVMLGAPGGGRVMLGGFRERGFLLHDQLERDSFFL